MLDRWQDIVQKAQSLFEAGVGATLFSLPFWHHILTGVSEIAQTVTMICGAVIGVHGVYRIWRRYPERRSDDRGAPK